MGTSIGSIILGLLLVRQNREKSCESTEDVVSATDLILLNSLKMAPTAQADTQRWTRNTSHHI